MRFVCPVFNADSQAGAHVKNAITIANGDTSILPGATQDGPRMISVPLPATNGGGDGAPGGEHSSVGDTDYSAVWAN